MVTLCSLDTMRILQFDCGVSILDGKYDGGPVMATV